MSLWNDLKRFPFIAAFIAAMSLLTVTTYLNPLLLKTKHIWTTHIVAMHEGYFEQTVAGSVMQRTLIPHAAEGLKWVMDHTPGFPRLVQVYLGKDHGIPTVIFSYMVIHFGFFFLGFLGVYWFMRRISNASPTISLLTAGLFCVYESFALTGFTTGRWTDPAIPTLLVWSLNFLLTGQKKSYLGLLVVFAFIREVAVFLIPFSVLWIYFQGDSKSQFKKLAPTLFGSFAVILGVRIFLYWYYRDFRLSQEGDGLSDSFITGIQANLTDSNAIKMPLAMHNFLLLFAWLGWREKAPYIKATALLAPIIYLVHLGFGSVGECYGRDLPVTLCLLLSSAVWMQKRLEQAEIDRLHPKHSSGAIGS